MGYSLRGQLTECAGLTPLPLATLLEAEISVPGITSASSPALLAPTLAVLLLLFTWFGDMLLTACLTP